MKSIIENLFYVGGAILIWGKLGSIALSLGLVLYGCYKFHKFLNRMQLEETQIS